MNNKTQQSGQRPEIISTGQRPMSQRPITRIVILESNIAIGERLQNHFAANTKFRVVGHARKSEDFFNMITNTPAELALISDENKNANVAKRLKSEYPHMKTFAIAGENSRGTLSELLKIGIAEVLAKRQTTFDILEASLKLIIKKTEN